MKKRRDLLNPETSQTDTEIRHTKTNRTTVTNPKTSHTDTKIRHTDTNRTTVTNRRPKAKTRVTTTVAQNTHERLK